MDLKKPEQYVPDMGHSVPQEHWDQIVPTITPPDKIRKHCLIERDNNGYRAHRRYGRLNE